MAKDNTQRGRPKTPDTMAAIIKGKWNAKQLAAIAFLSNPQGGSQEDLAAQVGVTRQTISEWKRLPGFMEDVHRVAAVFFLEADLAVDRANLRDAIKNPSDYPGEETAIIKARELYYKRRGLLIDKHEMGGVGGGPLRVEFSDTRLADVPTEELKKAVNALAAGSGRKGGGGGGSAA